MFQVSAAVQAVRTLVDGGCKLDIITQELQPEAMTELFNLKGKMGHFVFKESPILEKEYDKIEETPIDEFDKKSPSKRFHDRLFVYYKETYKNTKDFRSWYINTLETLGQQYLDKIN